MADVLLSTPQKQTAAFYDQAAARYARYTAQFDMEGVLGGFFAAVSRDHLLLDVGCGSGRDLTDALAHTDTVVGVDISCGLLREARRRLSAPLICADAQRLPIADSCVDRLIAIASLHHLPRRSQLRALSEIRRVLRSDGQALITLKVGTGVLKDSDRLTGQSRCFYLVPARRFLRRMRRAGLRVVIAKQSEVIRHGRPQTWLQCRVTRQLNSGGEPPIRRSLSAWRRRSWVPSPASLRPGL